MSTLNQVNAKTYESSKPFDGKILAAWPKKVSKVYEQEATSDLKKALELRYQIRVRDCFQEFSLGVTNMTIVKDMKAMIESKIGAPKEQLVLFAGKSSHQLEDSHNLAYYKIQENSVLWMLSPLLKLFIKMPQVGMEVPLNVYSSKTIHEIKDLIHKEVGIPFDKQSLIYDGKCLSNRWSLSDYGIQRNSTLFAVFGLKNGIEGVKLNLCINGPIGERLELQVEPSSSVLDIKAMVESKVGFSIGLQGVMFGHENLKDSKLMADYGIKDGSTLHVVKCTSTVDIYIKTPSTSNSLIKLRVDDSSTIEEIMDMIPEELAKIVGRPSIFFGDLRLQDNKTLAYYNIISGTFLSLERTIEVNVRIPNGEVVIVDLKPSDFIDVVKSKIKDACGIPLELQSLTYLKDELEDNYTLADYEIHLENLWVLRWLCGGAACSFFWPNYAGSVFSRQIK